MNKTRPGTRTRTRQPKSRAGGQEPFLRTLEHLGRGSEVKDCKSIKKVKCDGRKKRDKESRSTQLKTVDRPRHQELRARFWNKARRKEGEN